MEFNSVAMIETNGLVTSITALEAMLKLGSIKYLKKEVISNGQVAIFVSGNLPQLNRVLEAGIVAAKNVGNVVASSIIENPTKEILDVILEKKETAKPRRSKKRNVEIEKADTLFDNVIEDAILEEATKPNSDKKIIVEEEHLDIISVSDNEIVEEPTSSKEVIADLVSDEEIVTDNTFTEEVVIEKQVEKESVEIVEKIEEEISEVKELLIEEVIEEVKTDIVETLEVAKETENDEQSSLEVSEKIDETEDEKLDANDFSNMSHIERLRAEAKLELVENTTNNIIAEEPKENVEADESDNELSSMNVPQLRKLARSNPKFPIQGREISKANRKALLEYFKEIM